MKKNIKKSKNLNKLVVIIVIVGVISFLITKLLENKKESILGTSSCISLSVPAYFNTSYWITATGNLLPGTILIMNPNDGPGTAIDSSYVTKVQNAKNKQGKVFGYVYTNYGARSSSVVKVDIDKYKSWYGVTDIFFDEVSNSSSYYSYYQDLANYVHQTAGALVQLNPGVYPAEGYMNIGDIILTFESQYSKYATSSVPSWAANYPANKFAHLVYAVPDTASMNAAFTIAKQRNVGYVYITSDVLPNPWDSLPSYWNDEVILAQNSCTNKTTTAPINTPTTKPTATPTIKPTAMPTLKPTAIPTIKATTTINPTPKTNNTTGTVVSVPVSSGATNEYNLNLMIISTTVSGVTVGKNLWLAATTTDFPNLLTVGSSISGNLDKSLGWWVLKKATVTTTTLTPTPIVTKKSRRWNNFFRSLFH